MMLVNTRAWALYLLNMTVLPGKSSITNNFLIQLPKDKYAVCNINFSARTTSNQTQDIIFAKLDRLLLAILMY